MLERHMRSLKYWTKLITSTLVTVVSTDANVYRIQHLRWYPLPDVRQFILIICKYVSQSLAAATLNGRYQQDVLNSVNVKTYSHQYVHYHASNFKAQIGKFEDHARYEWYKNVPKATGISGDTRTWTAEKLLTTMYNIQHSTNREVSTVSNLCD